MNHAQAQAQAHAQVDIHTAILKGNLNRVKEIIESNINMIDSSNIEPIHYSIIYDKFDIFKYLVDNEPDLNKIYSIRMPSNSDDNYHISNGTILMKVIIEDINDIEYVKYLINKGADINIKNTRGQTALLCAIIIASDIDIDIIKLLVDSNTIIPDRYLRLANKKQNGDVIRLLLDHGCTISDSYKKCDNVKSILQEKEIQQLKNKIKELEDEITELKYRPPGVGGSGYELAKEEFESLTGN